MLVVLAPLAAQANDTGAAVVQAMRTAWLNGTLIPRISAIFPGDIVQTKTDLADIDAFGSKVLVLSDSLVKYLGDSIQLDGGSVSVATSKALATKIGCVTVRPGSDAWTEFQVTHSNGTVHITASKGNLVLSDENGTSVLNAGQETTRRVSPRDCRKSAGAAPAARGSVMGATTAILLGGATAGGVTGWVLSRGDDPISPDAP